MLRGQIADIDGLQEALDAKAAAAASAEAIAAVAGDLESHGSRTDNPHTVTKAQVGLEDVDNTRDEDKPISTLQQAALDAKVNRNDISTKVFIRHDFEGAGELNVYAASHNNTYVPLVADGKVSFGVQGCVIASGAVGGFTIPVPSTPVTRHTGFYTPLNNLTWKGRIWLDPLGVALAGRHVAGLVAYYSTNGNDPNGVPGIYFSGDRSAVSRSLSVVSNGTTKLTSAALFSCADVGKAVEVGNGISAGTFVKRYVSPSEIYLNQACSTSETRSRAFTGSGFWRLCNYDTLNGLTYVESNVAVVLSTFIELEMRRTNGNVFGYINGVLIGDIEMTYSGPLTNLIGGASIGGNMAAAGDYLLCEFDVVRTNG